MIHFSEDICKELMGVFSPYWIRSESDTFRHSHCSPGGSGKAGASVMIAGILRQPGL